MFWTSWPFQPVQPPGFLVRLTGSGFPLIFTVDHQALVPEVWGYTVAVPKVTPTYDLTASELLICPSVGMSFQTQHSWEPWECREGLDSPVIWLHKQLGKGNKTGEFDLISMTVTGESLLSYNSTGLTIWYVCKICLRAIYAICWLSLVVSF